MIIIMTSLLISINDRGQFVLTGECGVCFSNPDCTGAQITAGSASARDCCVGTDDGLSYSTPGNCRQCIGENNNA